MAAGERLNADIRTSVVVGDSVWDLLAARRAGALGVGLLPGGYGEDELDPAGLIACTRPPWIYCSTSMKSACASSHGVER